jgi:hypothetical protein
MESLDNLVAELDSAFPAVLIPRNKPLVLRPEEDFESANFQNFLFRVQTWKNLTLGRFRALYAGDPSITLFLLTAEAAAHCIPAYLTICLQHYREADTICPSLISFLSPQRQSDRGILGLRQFADALNVQQVRAIVHFLEYVKDRRASDFLNNEPEFALSQFWRPYLERLDESVGDSS